jgi:hypothetical protein
MREADLARSQSQSHLFRQSHQAQHVCNLVATPARQCSDLVGGASISLHKYPKRLSLFNDSQISAIRVLQQIELKGDRLVQVLEDNYGHVIDLSGERCAPPAIPREQFKHPRLRGIDFDQQWLGQPILSDGGRQCREIGRFKVLPQYRCRRLDREGRHSLEPRHSAHG